MVPKSAEPKSNVHKYITKWRNVANHFEKFKRSPQAGVVTFHIAFSRLQAEEIAGDYATTMPQDTWCLMTSCDALFLVIIGSVLVSVKSETHEVHNWCAVLWMLFGLFSFRVLQKGLRSGLRWVSSPWKNRPRSSNLEPNFRKSFGDSTNSRCLHRTRLQHKISPPESRRFETSLLMTWHGFETSESKCYRGEDHNGASECSKHSAYAFGCCTTGRGQPSERETCLCCGPWSEAWRVKKYDKAKYFQS